MGCLCLKSLLKKVVIYMYDVNAQISGYNMIFIYGHFVIWDLEIGIFLASCLYRDAAIYFCGWLIWILEK